MGMRFQHTERGFTLAEIVVVSAIIALVALISAGTFQNLHRASGLRASAGEVYRAFTDARTKTLASEDDTVYGVRIATTSVIRFTGPTYSAGAATNITYTFGAGVTATGTLAVSGTNITFQRLTGKPSATGTVYLRDAGKGSTTTITIHASGLIEYD